MKVTLMLGLLLLIGAGLYMARTSTLVGQFAPTVNAAMPNPTASPFGNDITISRCTAAPDPNSVKALRQNAARVGLVLDARPFAIIQSNGKFDFNGKTGQVTVLNMNPFVYRYKIGVAQDELVSTAITDFIKILLPDSLSKIVGPQSGGDSLPKSRVLAIDGLKAIEARLSAHPGRCNAAPASDVTCTAIATMYSDVSHISSALATLNPIVNDPKISVSGTDTSAGKVFNIYTKNLTEVKDEESDGETICYRAHQLQTDLTSYDLDSYTQKLKTGRDSVDRARSLANDLVTLVGEVTGDAELNKPENVIRCGGFKCFSEFKAYSDAALQVLATYDTQIDSLTGNGQEMYNMRVLLKQLEDKEGLFARTFMINRRFELSQATVTINREKIASDTAPATATNSPALNVTNPNPNPTGGGGGPRPTQVGGQSGTGSAPPSGGNGSGTQPAASANSSPSPTQTPAKPATTAAAPKGDVVESVTIGRPRFSLSGGLVYSPLARHTFESVKGFVRDAQGNPSGTGNDDVIGFGQNSSRRLLPMAFLNSRIVSGDSASLFFSVGATAKHDDNLDIEYLFGPSIGFLNDRALFTIGAYGGKQQNLVSDLRIGQQLPSDAGDAKLFRKTYTWKPGFSFSYSFSQAKKNALSNSGAGNAASNDVSDELHIGAIPFNLAVGLAFTSLEDRTYDEIAGFARDRQGNLTNDQTLTRIVGLTSSSNYRLTPLLLLHTRLIDFGKHSFYFSSGITGKKTDNDFDIEYLLGGSLNVYRRKVFLTFGTFIGKQQILGGDFFEGAKLDKTQNVTIQNRYVWKPAFSFSYDISRITKAIPH